jgi:hypothetical protein
VCSALAALCQFAHGPTLPRQPSSTIGFVCPTYPYAALRVFQNRVVCDECNGMLIGSDDIAVAIHELDGTSEPLALVDDRPARAACPRCRAAMSTCTLRL